MLYFRKGTGTFCLLLTVYYSVLVCLTGCTSSNEILKYQSNIHDSMVPMVQGMEPEELKKKIAINVKGQGLEPENGTPQQKKLMAERAAVIDGYRKLSERISGTILNAYSTAGYNNITFDQVTSETNSYLRGAQVMFVSFDDGVATANVRVYISPREIKYYHGTPLSRTILGALAGATIGVIAGSAAAAALGPASATLGALGGTSGAMAIGAAAGAIGGGALSKN
jgi:hypothetical protein